MVVADAAVDALVVAVELDDRANEVSVHAVATTVKARNAVKYLR